jgi:hypothetical protein
LKVYRIMLYDSFLSYQVLTCSQIVISLAMGQESGALNHVREPHTHGISSLAVFVCM